MINPKPNTIEEILSSSQQLKIPEYQRNFAWGKSEALEFLEDVRSFKGNNGGLFLGTLIFHVTDKAENKLVVVDGQQRLTTVLLLLIACRERSKELQETSARAAGIQDLISFVDRATAKSLGSRLLCSDSIRDVFDHMANSTWDGTFPSKVNGRPVKRQVNLLRPIYDFFRNETRCLEPDQLTEFLNAIFKSYVVRIDIQDEEEAFKIFERTNARGRDLEASDLLKNYLFSTKMKGMDDKWDQIVENSDGTVLRMLKYFYVAKKGYISKAKLYKSLKTYAKDVGTAQLSEELLQFSKFYNIIRVGDRSALLTYFSERECKVLCEQDKHEKVFAALDGLRLFKVAQVYPLIYSATMSLLEADGGNDKSLTKKYIVFLKMLENYHFVNTAVCNRMGNEVEKLYAEYSCRFSASNDFDSIHLALRKELLSLLASEKEFCAAFEEIAYSSKESIPLIAYIFDRINNQGLRPGPAVQIYNADPRVLRKNFNIEHFFPQKPADGNGNKLPTPENVDNIGNLLVIGFGTNSKLQNVSPEEKMKLLKGKLHKEIQGFAYILDFIERYEDVATKWNDDVILQRARDLAVEGYKKVWKL